MKHIEFKVHASGIGIEMVTGILLRYGIDSVVIDDPGDVNELLNKKQEYGWDCFDVSLRDSLNREPSISVYLEDNEKNRTKIQNLKIEIMKLKHQEQDGKLGDLKLGRLYSEYCIVDDETWKDKWKEHFKPIKVTDRIVVKPTWEEYTPSGNGELVLEIDPGIAFGTGTHETTSLCMKLLEKYMSQRDAKSIKVLDAGCGSGILAIASALLGCDNVLGVEIDPDAVRIARENADLNGVADAVKVQEGDLMKGIDACDRGYKADIVLANLMHDLIVKLAPNIIKHMETGGIFISSGILIEKKNEVAIAVGKAGFDILEILEDGEWCAIVAVAKS